MPDTITIPIIYPNGDITIQTVPVLAQYGLFVVTPTFATEDHFTVTHAPTRWACLDGFRYQADAEACALRLAQSGLDWTFTDPAAMTAAHAQVLRALAHDSPPRWIVPLSSAAEQWMRVTLGDRLLHQE